MRKLTDIAWAAGLFDGEGCVTTRWPKRFQLTLEIQMCHKPTLDRFASIIGGGVKKSYEHRRNHRTQWRWRVTDKKAIDAALLLMEFSSEKYIQLYAAIKFKQQPISGDRDIYADMIKLEKGREFN